MPTSDVLPRYRRNLSAAIRVARAVGISNQLLWCGDDATRSIIEQTKVQVAPAGIRARTAYVVNNY